MEYESETNLAELLTLGKKVNRYGDIFYYNQDNQFHRVHGPAVIFADGGERWYRYNVLHRIDGPAVTRYTGDKYWFKDGLLHREDGPAVEKVTGINEWHQYGIFIRREPGGTTDSS